MQLSVGVEDGVGDAEVGVAVGVPLAVPPGVPGPDAESEGSGEAGESGAPVSADPVSPGLGESEDEAESPGSGDPVPPGFPLPPGTGEPPFPVPRVAEGPGSSGVTGFAVPSGRPSNSVFVSSLTAEAPSSPGGSNASWARLSAPAASTTPSTPTRTLRPRLLRARRGPLRAGAERRRSGRPRRSARSG